VVANLTANDHLTDHPLGLDQDRRSVEVAAATFRAPNSLDAGVVVKRDIADRIARNLRLLKMRMAAKSRRTTREPMKRPKRPTGIRPRRLH
jgi:hypothetical protein